MEPWSGGNLAELPPEAGKCVCVCACMHVRGRPHRTPGTTPVPHLRVRRQNRRAAACHSARTGVRKRSRAGACTSARECARRLVRVSRVGMDIGAGAWTCAHACTYCRCAQARAAGHSARVGPMESVAIGYRSRSRSRSGAHEAADAGLLRAPTDTQTDTHTRARTHAFPHSSTRTHARTHARAHARSVN